MVVGEKCAISCEGCGFAVPLRGRRSSSDCPCRGGRRRALPEHPPAADSRQYHEGSVLSVAPAALRWPPDRRQRGEGAVGWLSVPVGPGAACASVLAMGTNWQSS